MLSRAATCQTKWHCIRGGPANQSRLSFNINVEMELMLNGINRPSSSYRHPKLENHLLHFAVAHASRLHCVNEKYQRRGGRFAELPRFSRAITRKPLAAETIRHRLPRAVHANDVHLHFSRNIARGFTRLRKTRIETVYDRSIKSLPFVIFNKLIISQDRKTYALLNFNWFILRNNFWSD